MSSLPRSGVVVLGQNTVHSLLPSTLISQAETLLESHRINKAADLADQQRKKLQLKASADADEIDELRYVYQRIGFQCFMETRFEEAGIYLSEGELDPRVLISYYPDLRGSLFSADDCADVFIGVMEHMPSESSVDDIIVANLVRNYSPHLPPNTREAPQTVELRRMMGLTARDMLQRFLQKSRTKRRKEESSILKQPGKDKGNGKAVSQVEDTVLVKLFAQSKLPDELYALLQGPNDVVLSEVETVLRENGFYRALCMMFQQHSEDDKLLDIWSRLVDGEWADDSISDPIKNMTSLLAEKKDRALTQKWGVWITKRDPDRGLKLLMSRDSNKRKDKPEEELLMFQQIQAANAVAGAHYLEYLILQRRSVSRELHSMLATRCLDDLTTSITNGAVLKLWRAKELSYASSRNGTPYFSYFASTTPDSEHKRQRLKAIIFLQGSNLYDPSVVRQRLVGDVNGLNLELAIVEGKLGNHRSALTTLVHKLRDTSSAEAYCTLGGDVIPPKVARSVAEKYGLQQWTTALFPPPVSTKPTESASPIASQKSIDNGLKSELLKVLLEVYMADEEFAQGRTAQLLNSQSLALDVLDVVPVIPETWPLNAVSSFLARSFRRMLHAQHEGQIVKAISAGQNLDVADDAWTRLREYGAIVEEAVDDEDDDEREEKGVYDENGMISEKSLINAHGNRVHIPPYITDVHGDTLG